MPAITTAWWGTSGFWLMDGQKTASPPPPQRYNDNEDNNKNYHRRARGTTRGKKKKSETLTVSRVFHNNTFRTPYLSCTCAITVSMIGKKARYDRDVFITLLFNWIPFC